MMVMIYLGSSIVNGTAYRQSSTEVWTCQSRRYNMGLYSKWATQRKIGLELRGDSGSRDVVSTIWLLNAIIGRHLETNSRHLSDLLQNLALGHQLHAAFIIKVTDGLITMATSGNDWYHSHSGGNGPHCAGVKKRRSDGCDWRIHDAHGCCCGNRDYQTNILPCVI